METLKLRLSILIALVCLSSESAIAVTKKDSGRKNKRQSLESVILTFNPKISKDYAKKLAKIAKENAVKHNLDPHLILSILNTESSFNQRAISSTNDISIAQINTSVWTPEYFKKVTGESINQSKLLKDEAYAVSRMCLILKHYKKRYPKDKNWFARYHSGTPVHKERYSNKVKNSLRCKGIKR
jgi:soluble lytic murein transglycosylase-like protein